MFALALTLALLGAGPDDDSCNRSGDRCSWTTGRAKNGFAFFEFAPASGAGLPSAGNLCDQLAPSEKVGNWWCLNGDGTAATGSGTLTAGGSPTSTTLTQCPAGPNCSTKTAQVLRSGANYYTTGNVASPTDFTACALLQPDPAGTNIFIGRQNATTYTFILWTSAGASYMDVFRDNATKTQTSAGALISGSVHLVCGTYDYVSDGTSLQRTYLDGVGGAASTTAVGPPQAQTEETRIGNRELDGLTASANVLGAFVIPSALSDARIAAIARAVLADTPTGAKGEALTYSRTGVRFCDSAGLGTTGNAGSMCNWTH